MVPPLLWLWIKRVLKKYIPRVKITVKLVEPQKKEYIFLKNYIKVIITKNYNNLKKGLEKKTYTSYLIA